MFKGKAIKGLICLLAIGLLTSSSWAMDKKSAQGQAGVKKPQAEVKGKAEAEKNESAPILPLQSESAGGLLYRYNEYINVYEFHTDYVKITSLGKKTSKEQFDWIFECTPSLYSSKDIYDIKVSENIHGYESTVTKDRWRGVIYENVCFSLRTKDIIEPGEVFSYWISFKTKRLPHLHTQSPIKKNIMHHLGINTAPSDFVDKNIRIVVIPRDSTVEQTFGYLPSKKKLWKDWRLFFYDCTKIKENISLHIKFSIFKDAPELDPLELLSLSKEE